MQFGYLFQNRDQLHNYDMSEATRLLIEKTRGAGHRAAIFFVESLIVKNGTVFAEWHDLEEFERKEKIKLHSTGLADLRELDFLHPALFPPLDPSVVYKLDQLDVPMVNDPAEILRFGEKIAPLHQSDLMAWTVVGKDPERIYQQLLEAGREKYVLKPVRTFGGEDVQLLEMEDEPFKQLDNYQEMVAGDIVAQEKLPVRETGDKRVLILEDEILGWENRIVKGEGIVANYCSGGEIVGCELTREERDLIKQVRVHFQEFDLPFAGVDIIDNTVTEVNVTNPGGLSFVKELNDRNPGEKVVNYFEQRARHSTH